MAWEGPMVLGTGREGSGRSMEMVVVQAREGRLGCITACRTQTRYRQLVRMHSWRGEGSRTRIDTGE